MRTVSSSETGIEATDCAVHKVGLAVSGGADSVALLVLMSELRKEHGFEA
ncbi:MAG: hypothetical protein J6N18_07700, partial [Kiritimatiellae bacterium]|nr:hypothetical protein [Kiritimatiellia bacterium]